MRPIHRFARAFASATSILMVFAAAASSAVAATDAEDYASRRAALARQLGPDAMLVLLSPAPVVRNGDVDWPFRQEDNLLYLTGLDAPETMFVLLPGESEHREIVFTRDSDPTTELWTGHIATHDEVKATSGVGEVASSSRFRAFLQAAMEGRPWGGSGAYRGYAGPGLPDWTKKVREGRATIWMLMESRNLGGVPTPELALVEEMRRSYPELKFRDAFPLLTDMRMRKSPSELATVQRAIDITIAAQKAAMRRVSTATHEYQVEATIEHSFRSLGACCWAFPSIVASGRNATTLHYGSNNDPVVQGGLLLTDIGAEVDGYSADITRTYPQNGTFTAEQRAIYEAVLRAQSESITLMKPGKHMRDVHEKAGTILGEELLRLGLIAKNEPEQVRWYFPHGLGHHLGLRTHDVNDRAAVLAPGMIITNEPGLYIRAESVRATPAFKALTDEEREGVEAALAKYDGIGVRIEDDILITDGEPRNLSIGAPRTVDEIEAWMRGDG
jgi:Xaa-Pro aminopeptidase